MHTNYCNIYATLQVILGDKAGTQYDNIYFDDTNLSLHLDSLDEIEMLMQVEDEFNIEITDEEINDVKHVEDFYNLIISKMPIQLQWSDAYIKRNYS